MQLQGSDPYGPYYSSLYSHLRPVSLFAPFSLKNSGRLRGGGLAPLSIQNTGIQMMCMHIPRFAPEVLVCLQAHAHPTTTEPVVAALVCVAAQVRPQVDFAPCRAACSGGGGGERDRGGGREGEGGERNAGPYKGYFIRKPIAAAAWGGGGGLVVHSLK
uniref:Uncharacterized protein n=1 Tax=Morchella brunnea TaxID=1174671 RepID=A0A8K1I785_9PEZI|nr:hypothetical protein LK370_mgp236 [Morchella brunnea]UBU98352.1 hypothetical protein [Morchella brunnea]